MNRKKHQIDNPLSAGQKFLNRAFDLRGLTRWLALGCVVGVVAGLGAVLFHYTLELVKEVSFNQLMGLSVRQPGNEHPLLALAMAEKMKPVWIIVLPTIGAFLGGLLVWKFAPEAKGHGTDAAIASFHRKGGHIRKRVPVVKFFATILTIGSGGSGGVEGPIAQIGAGFGSFIATRLKLGAREKRMMMVAGLGAGIGAIFKAPLAGAIFAAEVLYSDPDIETDVIIPACVCSIIAYCVYGVFNGFGQMLPVSHMSFTSPLELGPYLLLALFVSAGALLYIWVFYSTEALFSRLQLPFIVKPAIGGLLTGLVALILLTNSSDNRVIDVMSNGYGLLQDALSGDISRIGVGVLLTVAIGKILTTSFSIASGGSAGVFGPSMVIGGTLGGAAGMTFHQWWPNLVTNPSTFTMVGMAGFFAAAANTPLSTVIMVSEMTGDYSLLVPTVWVCSITFLASRRWTIYSNQVPSKINSPAHIGEYAFEIMGKTHVSEVYKENRRFVTIPEDLPVTLVLSRTGSTRQRIFPVVTKSGRLAGVFHYRELIGAVQSGPDNDAPILVSRLMHTSSEGSGFPCVRLSDPVSMAHRRMTGRHVEELVVLSDDLRHPVGILTASDVLLAFNQRLASLSSEPDNTDVLPEIHEHIAEDEQESERISEDAAAISDNRDNTTD